MTQRSEIVDRFVSEFEENNAGRDVIEALDFASKNGCGHDLKSAVAQSFRAMERDGLISFTKGPTRCFIK